MSGKQSSHIMLVTDQENSGDGSFELGHRRQRLRDLLVCVWTRFFVVLLCRRLLRRGRRWRGCATFLDMGIFGSHADSVEVEVSGKTSSRVG